MVFLVSQTSLVVQFLSMLSLEGVDEWKRSYTDTMYIQLYHVLLLGFFRLFGNSIDYTKNVLVDLRGRAEEGEETEETR